MTAPDERKRTGTMTGTTAAAAAPGAADARQSSETAARAAGVSVREVTGLHELDDVIDLFATIWGRSANPPITIELLRAFTKAGNYVGGAFDGEKLVGACVGFFHAPAEDALHSHIAGVSPEAAGRKIGFALKLHQRAWAMSRGISEIAWTYDPLVSRNAYFNLVKLGARPEEYLPNFYGAMLDTINGDGDSDRLLVRWRLDDPAVVRACRGPGTGARPGDETDPEAVVALGVCDDGRPLRGRLDAATSLVAVPGDITALRATDPALARHWRHAVRDALTTLTADGGRIEGFDRAGRYIVRRNR